MQLRILRALGLSSRLNNRIQATLQRRRHFDDLGQLFSGFNRTAGEIGHMVVRQGGALCPCGASGHLEAYIGSRALESRGRAAASSPDGEGLRARGRARMSQLAGDR